MTNKPKTDRLVKVNCRDCHALIDEGDVYGRNCEERCYSCRQIRQAELRELHEDSLKYGGR